MAHYIWNDFPVNTEEYGVLSEKFGKLCYYVAQQLKKKNYQNMFLDEVEDVYQELQFSLMQAGSYYKRQTYMEKSLEIAKKHIKDQFLFLMLMELEDLWRNKTHHGAKRQRFGKFQELLLENMVEKQVPQEFYPNKNAKLEIDNRFTPYCKAIIWNSMKSMGKKITKEKSIRLNQVSLSEFDYLSSEY